jgi:membrane associated rhomboid family serine protease
MSKNEVKAIADELTTHAIVLGSLVALMWAIEIADVFVFRGQLDSYGILPRQIVGLRGILFMPFLHGNFPHLIANTIPFIILGWMVMLREIRDFFVVTAVTMAVGGLGVWLFGSPGFHIGASGLIFGYLGFLLLRGLFERSFGGIFLSVVVGFLYGGLIWGVLPGQPGVSWEGHLFGFLGGVLAARLLSRR